MGGSVSWASDFGSGHDLAVREFEPRVGLWADGSEPGACFRFCVSPSLCPSPTHALSPSVSKINKNILKNVKKGRLGGSVSWASDFGSGHDLAVREFKPRVGLHADSSEPGACFRFCVSLSLCPSPAHALSLSVSKINKR